MGLLDTVLVTKDIKKKSFNDFILKEKELSEDETYSSKALELISGFFGITKGVILVYHPKEGLWQPVSVTGIDITSTRRIRFNKNFMTSMFNPGVNNIQDQEKLLKFKPFLSIREFSALNNISVYLLENTAFLTFNSHISGDIPRALEIILRKISAIDSSLKNFILKDSSIVLFVSQYLSRFSDSAIFLIKINYEELLSFISESAPESHEFQQLSQDIFDTVYSMINISGRILQIDAYSSLLLFSSKSLKTPELLIKQIAVTLKNYFNIHSDIPVIKSTFVSFPDDGREPEKLLLKLDIL